MEILVGMAGEGQRRETAPLDVDAELFAQFARESGFRGLALLDLAAGKLPQARHGLALGTSREQHAAVAIDKSDGRDQDQVHER